MLEPKYKNKNVDYKEDRSVMGLSRLQLEETISWIAFEVIAVIYLIVAACSFII